MTQFLITLVVFTGMLPATAFADEAKPAETGPSITLVGARAGEGSVEAQATVFGNSEALPGLELVGSGVSLAASARLQPMDLWLVVDNSAVCAKYQADRLLSSWVAKLARELPSGSRVSLLAFRRGAFEMLATQQEVRALPVAKLRCQAGSVSSDPERALNYVVETDVPEGLSRAVWILSSGNLAVSKPLAAKLQESATQVSFHLYNPPVFAALGGLFEAMRSKFGEGLFQAALATPALPARTYALSAPIPANLGGTVEVVATLEAKEGVVRSGLLRLHLPKAEGPSVLAQIAKVATLLALVGLLTFGIVRLVRFYRPRHCGECKNRLRYHDPVCPFCFAASGAYLVAQNPLGEAAELTAPLVAPLHREATVVGTHRRSALRCLRGKRERRRAYFTLHRENGGYRLQSGVLPVFVNGVPVPAHRFLASGDRIQVGRGDFRFIQASRSTHA